MNKQNEQIISAAQARDILNKPTNFINNKAKPEIKKALNRGEFRCEFSVTPNEANHADILFLRGLGYKVNASD